MDGWFASGKVYGLLQVKCMDDLSQVNVLMVCLRWKRMDGLSAVKHMDGLSPWKCMDGLCQVESVWFVSGEAYG